MKAKTIRMLREIVIALIATVMLLVTVAVLNSPDYLTSGCIQGLWLFLLMSIGLIIIIVPKPIASVSHQ